MSSKAERTRQYIIEKAAPLFNTKGYAATSMSDIMQVTGLAKGGLYGNFESKDQLAREALLYCFDQVQQAIRVKTKLIDTYKGKLLAILDFYKNYSTYPVIEGGCPLLNSAIEADDQLPAIKEISLKFMKESISALTLIIQCGIDRKEFKPTLHAHEQAIILFATIEGGIMMSKLAGSPKILNDILDRIKKDILDHYSI